MPKAAGSWLARRLELAQPTRVLAAWLVGGFAATTLNVGDFGAVWMTVAKSPNFAATDGALELFDAAALRLRNTYGLDARLLETIDVATCHHLHAGLSGLGCELLAASDKGQRLLRVVGSGAGEGSRVRVTYFDLPPIAERIRERLAHASLEPDPEERTATLDNLAFELMDAGEPLELPATSRDELDAALDQLLAEALRSRIGPTLQLVLEPAAAVTVGDRSIPVLTTRLRILGLPPGRHPITAKAADHRPLRVEVELGAEDVSVSLQLRPEREPAGGRIAMGAAGGVAFIAAGGLLAAHAVRTAAERSERGALIGMHEVRWDPPDRPGPYLGTEGIGQGPVILGPAVGLGVGGLVFAALTLARHREPGPPWIELLIGAAAGLAASAAIELLSTEAVPSRRYDDWP